MDKAKTNRRNLLVLGSGLAAVAAGWQLWLGREAPLEFIPIPNLPNWRQITFDGISGGGATGAVFAGLDPAQSDAPLSAQALCATLYPKAGKGIPAAVFTDVNCPNCARLEAKLKSYGDQLALNWLDLPLLGPNSEIAARAMAAGDLQPNGPAFRTAVLATAPGRLIPSVLARIAQDNGLNAQQLASDMQGPKVEAHLTNVRRAAATLGVWGTPGFTIGRTFVLGDMRQNILDQLIQDETNTSVC